MALDQTTLDQLRIDRPGDLPRPVRRGAVWVWVGIVLAILALFYFGRRYYTEASTPLVKVAVVREVSADEGGVRTVLNGSGYVTARREATVSAKITGKVIEVLVEEGKRVEVNQILARLDSSNLNANRQLAEAQLGSAKIAVKETSAHLEEARLTLGRQMRLVADKISSLSELDKAKAEFQSLQAREQRQVFEITVAEKALALWDQQLEDTIIRAPFAGVVTAKNAQPGEVISPMSSGGFTRTGICTLVDMESLEIEVDVNESYINRIQPGQSVVATLDAYADWKIPCKVIAIIPTADRQKATVRVRVAFESLDPRILPQMGVKVAFQGAAESAPVAGAGSGRRWVVPVQGIQEREGRQIAWVVKEGRVERRAVDAISSAGADGWQIGAGLSAGDRVVLDAPAALTDGAKVREAME